MRGGKAMFLSETMDRAAQETAQAMHDAGVTEETPVKGMPHGFFLGTIPFREVEAVDGRRVMPLNRYTIDGKIYFLYQRMN